MKTREDIVLELLKSLNIGDSGYIDNRVEYATRQYNQLVAAGIIKEDKNE